jgi:hypothetical protein
MKAKQNREDLTRLGHATCRGPAPPTNDPPQRDRRGEESEMVSCAELVLTSARLSRIALRSMATDEGLVCALSGRLWRERSGCVVGY